MNFNEACSLVRVAKKPEDVFPSAVYKRELAAAYRALAAVLHPDANPSRTRDAESAFQKLGEWRSRAERKMRDGSWGDGEPHVAVTLKDGSHAYELYGRLRKEALFDVCAASMDGAQVQIFAGNKPACELLLPATADHLRMLGGRNAPKLLAVPRLLKMPTYVTTRPPQDMVTIGSLMTARDPVGLPLDHALRYTDTLLQILGPSRQLGIAHASVNPNTFWVRPHSEEGWLDDWHYSVRVGGVAPYVNETYAEFAPWEVQEGKPTDRGTDLAAAMKLLRAMVRVEDMSLELQHVIDDHMREGRARPVDADATRRRLRDILSKL